MGTTKSYWKGVEEKLETPEFLNKRDNEFAQEVPVDAFLSDSNISDFTTGRRDFLKFLGFSVAAATLASCESPVIKAIPYANKPEDVTPGVANWYATSYYDGNDYASILVKTREGRPIYVKGNKDRGVNKGGINPRISASVLSLYNSARLRQPMIDGNAASWDDVDATVKAELTKITASGGAIRLLTNTIMSPSTETAVADFMTAFGGEANVKHVTYDAVSYSAMRKANQASFGKAVIPSYDFSKAETIVSIGADFLTSWLMSNQYAVDYASGRNPENGSMSQHFQFETIMSVTGANADFRSGVKPSQMGMVAAAILEKLQGKSSTSVEGADETIDKAVKALKQSKGKSLVVAGVNDENVQTIVNAINAQLGNYGTTIDLDNYTNLKKGDDAQVEQLVKDVESGKVSALLMFGVNPVYTLPNGAAFGEALSKVGLSVAFSEYADETASKCKVVCAESHAFESWNDYNPVVGHYAVSQPVIRPLFETRQMQESLLVWAGKSARPSSKDNTLYHDYIKANWEANGFPTQKEFTVFSDYWHMSVHNGYATMEPLAATAVTFAGDTSKAISKVKSSSASGWEYVLYQKSSIGDGSQAANPWLQEMPDPITKVTWDNYITMSLSDAAEMFGTDMAGLYIGEESPARVAKINVNGVEMSLPVFPLPGQAKGTIGIALGYGRAENGENIGKAAFQTGEYGGYGETLTPIGANAFKLASFAYGNISYMGSVSVEATSEKYPLACTQTHHTIMGRTSVVKETNLATYLHSAKNEYNKPHTLPIHEHGTTVDKPVSEVGLWDEHPVETVGHRWGMAVDLNLCNGCGTCLVACQVENNVPVVGKDEVRRSREMHWLRLDRYFSSDTTKENGKDLGAISMYRKMEIASENPEVVFMPMMCQHCNHAPCETVCPVAATTHSNEGLNQMTYNRCIGTRYCANNCPYKVRRFNWFNYMGYKKFTEVNPSQDDLGRMVLNPDVTVRARGVMEKCSMCVQKIQEGKLSAKSEGRVVKDGDVTTACAEACPTNAIVFGDWNDTNSALRKSTESTRAYQALEEVGVKPNIWYKVKVRNNDSEATTNSATASHTEQH
jgi:MoCo/4Fe-4S cofactor protein with predicted Tat translocation signal